MVPRYMERDKDGNEHSKFLSTAVELVRMATRNASNEYYAYIMLWHIREVSRIALDELEDWMAKNDEPGLIRFKYGFEKYKLYQLK